MAKTKKRSNWGNEAKLLANREPNHFKAQQKKGKSISITEKPNLFNQITVITIDDEEESVSRCQQKKKSDQICKGKSLSDNNATEHMDMDMDMDIVYSQAMGIQFDDEIIMEILKRLPVQSILSCKSVLKSWNALVSDPYFKMKHLNHAKNDQNSQKLLISRKRLGTEYMFNFYCSSLSLVQVVEDEKVLDCPSNCEPVNSVLYCSCDGLVLLAVTDDIDKHLLLWNPSIQESVVLPYPQSQLVDCVCGLAYDAISDDYKILAADLNRMYPSEVILEILALKGGSWKSIWKLPSGICRAPAFLSSGMDSLAFVHGSFHWVGLSHCYTIVSFNISNEVYGGEIPLLEQMWNTLDPKLTNRGVSVLGGKLCFYYADSVRVDGMFKLWVMKDYSVKESWMELLTIQSFSFFSAIPVYMYADGEVLLRCIYNGVNGSVFKTSRDSFDFVPTCHRTLKQGIVYTESLISPKSLI